MTAEMPNAERTNPVKKTGQAVEERIKIRITSLHDGMVGVEISKESRVLCLFTARRETARKVLEKQFPGVEIKDEGVATNGQ